jgi:acetyl-CoA carboxylase biotin carboxylase subunit
MRLRRALEEIFVGGIKSNIALHRRIIAVPDFINGDYDIRSLERMVASEG